MKEDRDYNDRSQNLGCIQRRERVVTESDRDKGLERM